MKLQNLFSLSRDTALRKCFLCLLKTTARERKKIHVYIPAMVWLLLLRYYVKSLLPDRVRFVFLTSYRAMVLTAVGVLTGCFLLERV